MGDTRADMKSWQDWTDPDFFDENKRIESRFMPLFMRQFMPTRVRETKLTLTGWMLIIVSLAIGSAAYNTSSNILFLTLSLLLSSLILSGILSLLNFRKLTWSLIVPSHLQVGEAGMGEVNMDNRKNLFPTMGICFRVESSIDSKPKRLFAPYVLSANEGSKVEWTFVPKERGYCAVRLLGAESSFPFGFMRKAKLAEVEEKVLVWPARVEYSFKPVGDGRRFLSGVAKRKVGQGSDLLSLRPYERGDPPRLVHWKATARMNRLMIRQLAEEGESGFHLFIDPDAEIWSPSNFELMCSLVCSLADDLFQSGRLESVTVSGESPELIRGIRDLHDFFDRLAILERSVSTHQTATGWHSNTISFRPDGSNQLAIYIGENKAGQTHA